ncbi:amidohydrolase family protein [Alkalilacustris brevis]|uniref:amidohydrolase family protein n=1 Tax=Alkalilacustris brevis TaxID=2026338 RepID=UPI0013904C00|nr:amidohydrolase family protein [Alkalilacustris brevis]
MQRVIDVHAHVVNRQVYSETSPHSIFTRLPSDVSDELRQAAAARGERVIAEMADYTDRIAAMDRMGVDMQILSPSLVHQNTDFADPKAALALCRRTNDSLAAGVETAPDRFRGLGMVPLHAPDIAAEELTRCVNDLGLSGVTISTRAGAREIGENALRPFWAAAEATGAVVYIHPAGNHDPRFARYMLWNSLGQCMEETFAIASLFYEGILDAFPDLKICISHGGGYMPFNTGRIDRNYIEKPATRVNMSKAPGDYLRMLHYDTCLYDPVTLEHLIDKVGADRVLLGSDYPVGEPDPVGFVGQTSIGEADRAAILGGNAARLFGIR